MRSSIALFAALLLSATAYGQSKALPDSLEKVKPVIVIDYNTRTVTATANGIRLFLQSGHIRGALSRRVSNSVRDSTHVLSLSLPDQAGPFSVDVEAWGSYGRHQTWFQGVIESDTLVKK